MSRMRYRIVKLVNGRYQVESAYNTIDPKWIGEDDFMCLWNARDHIKYLRSVRDGYEVETIVEQHD